VLCFLDFTKRFINHVVSYSPHVGYVSTITADATHTSLGESANWCNKILVVDKKIRVEPLQPFIEMYQVFQPAALVFYEEREIVGKLWFRTNGNDATVRVPVFSIAGDHFWSSCDIY
jgi:hypothetical protein